MSEVRNGVSRRLAAAARSDRGRVRANNEDLPLLDVERGIYGVIDGVGGQNAGELAASIARDVILQRLGRPLGTPDERVREAIAIANNEIFRRASLSPDLAGMTCVVTLALVHGGALTIGHVGDTRLYKIRPDGLRKLTHDHSPVGEREDAQELSEADAMRHPRRHEVFRDVGSALRDKDEDDYVEVVEEALEDDGAILVCSDGLTDMITSGAIEQIVRAHAGNPDAVADALIAAANEAGGRDNVTVVYAEAPAFAAAMRRRASEGKGSRGGGRGGGLITRAARAVAASRTTWFIVGAALGVLGALGFVWRTSEAPAIGGRTIAAAPAATETVGTLAAALSSARPGDIVRLEPGTYAEQVVLPPGVTLAARVPGGATFVRPPSVESSLGGEWVAITATGDAGGAISGISIASTAEQPIDVGLRVTGHGRAIELVEADGPMRVAMELADVSSARLEGSRFTVTGTPVAVGSDARLEAVGNVFRDGAENGVGSSSGENRVGSHFRQNTRENDSRPHFPAITLAPGAEAILRHNVFAGFGPEPVQGLSPAAREPFGRANVVLSAERSAAR